MVKTLNANTVQPLYVYECMVSKDGAYGQTLTHRFVTATSEEEALKLFNRYVPAYCKPQIKRIDEPKVLEPKILEPLKPRHTRKSIWSC